MAAGPSPPPGAAASSQSTLWRNCSDGGAQRPALSWTQEAFVFVPVLVLVLVLVPILCQLIVSGVSITADTDNMTIVCTGAGTTIGFYVSIQVYRIQFMNFYGLNTC